MGRTSARLGFATALGIALALTAPSAASAVDTYVDGDTGSDSNPCTEALPCETIDQGIEEVAGGDTVHVDPGTYANQEIIVGAGISVINDPFVSGTPGPATVSINGFSVVNVLATGAGTISGFTLSASTSVVIDVDGAVNFTGNTVLTGSATAGASGILVSTPAGADVTIEDNEFFGDNTTAQVAITATEGPDLKIIDNDFGSAGNGFRQGIFAGGSASAEITGNRFRALHQPGAPPAIGIAVRDLAATITANSVRDSGAGTVLGILIDEAAAAAATSASLHRNELYGQDIGQGIVVDDTEGPVTLNGDLIAGFAQGAVATNDVDADSATEGDVSITGATLWNNGGDDIELDDADLTLDSSILDEEIGVSGIVSCAITFSRGATDAPGGNGCGDFQTTDDPEFVDPNPIFGDPDLHLTAASSMIDAGNPADPTELLDIDGGPRLTDGDQTCPEDDLVRDIGADEFGDAPLDCDPPQTRITGKRKSKKRRARFRLISDEPNSTFRCKLDRKPYRRCKARHRTKRLDPGRHRLKVKATDAAGNEDPTPAVKRFKVLEPK